MDFGEVLGAAVLRLTMAHPEVLATIEIEVAQGVGSHVLTYKIEAGELVGAGEFCGGP